MTNHWHANAMSKTKQLVSLLSGVFLLLLGITMIRFGTLFLVILGVLCVAGGVLFLSHYLRYHVMHGEVIRQDEDDGMIKSSHHYERRHREKREPLEGNF